MKNFLSELLRELDVSETIIDEGYFIILFYRSLRTYENGRN